MNIDKDIYTNNQTNKEDKIASKKLNERFHKKNGPSKFDNYIQDCKAGETADKDVDNK